MNIRRLAVAIIWILAISLWLFILWKVSFAQFYPPLPGQYGLETRNPTYYQQRQQQLLEEQNHIQRQQLLEMQRQRQEMEDANSWQVLKDFNSMYNPGLFPGSRRYEDD